MSAIRSALRAGAGSSTAVRPLSGRPTSIGLVRPAIRLQFTATPRRRCPSCGAPIPLSASPCPACSSLIPIPHTTHHALLDILPGDAASASSSRADAATDLARLPAHGFTLDVRDLRQRMLQRQRDLHPDKHGTNGELAKELSARVNKAYEVLASPLRRAEYILSEMGVETLETDSVTDLELLAEIMEAREALEEASGPEEIEAIRDANHEKVEATVAELTAAFAGTPPDYERARALCTQLRYWVGLEEAAKDKL